MKTKLIYLILLIAIFCSCNSNKKQDKQVITKPDITLIGKWVRIGQTGPIGFEFKENGLVEGDFGNDQTVDVVAKYELSGDTIKFIDEEGKMCQGIGQYKVYQTKYYVSFDLIDDDCGGRIKTTMGFWTKPNFEDFIKTLDDEIEKSPNAELYLNRARIYLAMGMTNKAKVDFDNYLVSDTLDARVYVNRAGTRFPNDLSGVVADCNKAISLAPDNKNAYFLRGLARYELGEKEQGCEDFNKAIELGFSVLRIAEQEKCIDYWKVE
ncbi:MAG: tetratricopeptide repeat protein [Ignavibacteria bacterium]|nr:tetratricopeptide repeat protein [Ignavibacteria bacterium]